MRPKTVTSSSIEETFPSSPWPPARVSPGFRERPHAQLWVCNATVLTLLLSATVRSGEAACEAAFSRIDQGGAALPSAEGCLRVCLLLFPAFYANG